MMKSKRTIFGISCLSTILIGIAVIAWFKFGVIQPYDDFIQKEQSILSLLDELNADVEQQLPPLPPKSKLEDKSFYGLDNSSFYKAHGRWLTLNISTSLTSDELFTYYHLALSERGWSEKKKPGTVASIYYYHETSCLRLGIPGGDSYVIVIWHDFEKQPFAPVIPHQNVTRFFEFGRNVAKCP